MRTLTSTLSLLCLAIAVWSCDKTAITEPLSRILPVSGGERTVAPPTLSDALFFGGGGDQRGDALAVTSGAVYVAGHDALGDAGVLVKYATPPGAPLWSATLSQTSFAGLAVDATGAYPVGQAQAQHGSGGVCGASDNVGSHERKSMLARYNASGGFLGCGSLNFFPYRGHEWYNSALAVMESGTPFVYVVGSGEQLGGASRPFVFTKYDASGGAVGITSEPGIVIGTGQCCIGQSDVRSIAGVGGDLFLAGWSRLTGAGEDNIERPVLMRYTPSLARVWKARPIDNPGGQFQGVSALGGDVIAVGHTQPFAAATSDFLAERYDAAGARIWTAAWGGGAEDVLTGVVAVGARLFAAGYTRSSGAGGADAVIIELDPATGAALSTTHFGGALDDLGHAAGTDGLDVYIAGMSRSFASADGNAIGQNDMFLLRYTLVLDVQIDIKPGTFPNSINPRKNGAIPVAVLTTADFDAATVDVSTVRFGVTGVEAQPTQAVMADVDSDGDLDLVVHFPAQSTGIACGATSAMLTGVTTGGQAIKGSDSIVTTGCK